MRAAEIAGLDRRTTLARSRYRDAPVARFPPLHAAPARGKRQDATRRHHLHWNSARSGDGATAPGLSESGKPDATGHRRARRAKPARRRREHFARNARVPLALIQMGQSGSVPISRLVFSYGGMWRAAGSWDEP